MSVKATFVRRFKAVVKLMGSPEEHERHSAADKAFEMCQAEATSLQEALEGAFGGDGGGSSNDDAFQARIDELQSDNEMMAEEVRRLQEQLSVSGGDEGYKAALRKIWSFPQTRIACAFLIIASTFIETTFWIPFRLTPIKSAFLPVIAYASSLYLFGLFFFDWISAEDRRNGSGVVFLKGIAIIGGVILSFYELFGTLAIGDWQGKEPNCVAAVLALGVTAIFSISNLVPMVVKKLVQSEEQPFKTLRAWFA